jgi:hypothetical protein
MRYDQILTLISLYRPRSIVEIGTNKGDRGIALCEEALKHNIFVSYVGYDVFDTKDKEFHEAAFNGKGAFSKSYVEDRFRILGTRHKGFSYDLIQGTTDETLHGKKKCANFVFIDGDHRTEVISSDFEAVRKSKVVVFDDYYVSAPGCGSIDIRKYGCNGIVDGIPRALILPIADRFEHIGDIHMAVVVKPHIFLRGRPFWLR